MTLQGFEGFDFYNGTGTTTGVGLRWVSDGTADVSVMVAGKYADGQALELGDPIGTGVFSRRRLDVPDFGPNFTIGLDLYNNNLSLASVPVFQIWPVAGGVAALTLGIAANGGYIVGIGGTAFASTPNHTPIITTAGGLTPVSTYRHVIMQGFIDDASGWVNLYAEDVDGVMQLVGSFTGDTKANAAADLGRIFLVGYGNTGSTWRNRFDNLYWANDSTMAIKVRRCRVRRPNADGDTLDLTPSSGVIHYPMVDETTFDNVDWLAGSTVGLFDDLELADFPIEAAAIAGVQVQLRS